MRLRVVGDHPERDAPFAQGEERIDGPGERRALEHEDAIGIEHEPPDAAKCLVQALVFALLSMTYITLAIAEHRQHGSDDHPSGEAPEQGTATAHGAV